MNCELEEQLLQLDRVVAQVLRHVLTADFTGKPHEYAEELIHAALDGTSPPRLRADESARHEVRVSHQEGNFMGTSVRITIPWARSATLEQLKAAVSANISLWTQVPCTPEQLDLQLDELAAAAGGQANGG